MPVTLTPQFLSAEEALRRAATPEEQLACLHTMRAELDVCLQRAEEEANGLTWAIPPLIQVANAAFQRDLPQMLNERRGQWVAYHGEKRVGFAKSGRELYRKCQADGIPDDEYVVYCIEPYDPNLPVFMGVVDFAGRLY